MNDINSTPDESPCSTCGQVDDGQVAPWPHTACAECGMPVDAIVDRPAPSTAQPPPVLDLDALEGRMRDGFGVHSDDVAHLIAEARAAVALRQELAALRAHFDAAAPEHNLPALLDLYNDRTTEAREKLAEAKRLGLEACDAAQMSDDQMMWATINITAIRAALEAL